MSGSWLDALQPASWNGVPFAVERSSLQAGRKTALHNYPFRDVVWVEDLGQKGRVFSFTGFLVGDDCYDQEDAMLAAAETPGPGQLVHPSLGALVVSLTEFSSGIEWERGRVVALNFTFVQGQPSPIYPGVNVSTQDNTDDAADDADGAVLSDYGNDMEAPLSIGSDVANGAAATISGFAGQVQGATGDAALLISAVAGLAPPPGFTYGRFSYGALGTVQAGVANVAQALANACAAQAAVQAAETNAMALADAL
jgi:prophage DNA circulation protein